MNSSAPDRDKTVAATKDNIRHFWKTVYETAYTNFDSRLTPETLLEALDQTEDMFRFREHMAAVEMDLSAIAGLDVLEIGCGAGSHSAMFARHGANVTSCDITEVLVAETRRKFRLLGPLGAISRAVQADAESLPFADGSLDIVYSNGVLHHTLDTERAIGEVHRLVKPGGRAVIMLYCKSSFDYWFNYWFCRGILCGWLFRSRNWLGHVTEWIGSSEKTATNPITRCYTRGQIRRMFAAFEEVRMRKSEFYFYLIPKLGRLYRRWQIKRYGTHPGGYLAYGDAWPVWSPLEAWLGKRIGWVWFISARKTS